MNLLPGPVPVNWILFIERIWKLENFLDHIWKDVSTEWNDIEKRRENGGFKCFGDYEHAMNAPISREEIGARAIFHELNALVESVLQAIAQPLWLNSRRYKGPKHPRELSTITRESIKNIKMVSDLPMKDIIGLIQNEYNVILDTIDGWDAFVNVRDKVNSFKHRYGWKHFKDIDLEAKFRLDELIYRVDFVEADEMLKQIYVLLTNLKRITEP